MIGAIEGIGTGWRREWFAWFNRASIVVMMLLTVVMLWKWGRATLWFSRSHAPRRDRRRFRASLAAMAILLLTLIVGGLILLLDLPNSPPGSCWILIGLTGFVPAIQAIGERSPHDMPERVPSWFRPTLEIVSSCLMMAMGVLGLC